MPDEQQLKSEQIVELVEQKNMQWVDQYNQMLSQTAQALHRLHAAFDEKFTR